MARRNVYDDLGYADADEMLVKAHLVAKIAEIIKRKGLTQVEAAKLLGLTQPKVSAMLRGQFRGFSERKLIDCLVSLGSDVQIVIKESPRRSKSGKLTVVLAAIAGGRGIDTTKRLTREQAHDRKFLRKIGA